MAKQVTSDILMIRPRNFGYNTETAVNNYYQNLLEIPPDQIQNKALEEFDNFVAELKKHLINVTVIEDNPDQHTTDSIFPNNWISFHEDGRVAIYPMYSNIRRKERRRDIIDDILPGDGFKISEVIDFTANEDNNKYLEGTGSMVLDRENKMTYASISERTDSEIVDQFAEKFSYQPVKFTSYQTVDGERKPIYHTNVMMCLGSELAIICAEAIDDTAERQQVIDSLQIFGKEVVFLTEDQLGAFAGNMLEVESVENKKFMIMSKAAHDSLTRSQINTIEKYCRIISSPLDTIEACGGGSARCMMAEIFLPHL